MTRKFSPKFIYMRSQIQSTFVISTSIISNNRLSRRETLVLALTQKFKIRLQNIVGKRSNSSPFPQHFQYIFLTKGVKLHSYLWNLVVRIVFSSILQIWYVKAWISRSVLEGPFDYEITRVHVICNFLLEFTYLLQYEAVLRQQDLYMDRKACPSFKQEHHKKAIYACSLFYHMDKVLIGILNSLINGKTIGWKWTKYFSFKPLCISIVHMVLESRSSDESGLKARVQNWQ